MIKALGDWTQVLSFALLAAMTVAQIILAADRWVHRRQSTERDHSRELDEVKADVVKLKRYANTNRSAINDIVMHVTLLEQHVKPNGPLLLLPFDGEMDT